MYGETTDDKDGDSMSTFVPFSGDNIERWLDEIAIAMTYKKEL